MKFRIKIINTTFFLPIEIGKEKEVIDLAKLTVETYGLIERNTSTKEKPSFRPTLFQHLFNHPFARTNITTIEVLKTENHSVLKYNVFHPLSFLFPTIVLFYAIAGDKSVYAIIPPAILLL